MALTKLTTAKQREADASRRAIKAQNKGKPPNVLTPPEKDEIMLTMAEALGFYDPTP